MNRIRYQWSEAISVAEALVPFRVRCDWFTGSDPIGPGLHNDEYAILDGRSYRDTAHTLYPRHSVDKRTTIVLPGRPVRSIDDIEVIIHEIGHVFDSEVRRIGRSIVPVSLYAETNQAEAFAEGFVRWILPVTAFSWWDCRPLDVDDLRWYESLTGEPQSWFV